MVNIKIQNMKKYIYRIFLALLATGTLASCSEDQGTEPGNDPNPMITVYQYAPAKPYNSDNDVIVRFAANSKTLEAYYLAEKTEDRIKHISSLGEEGYKEYIISNGTKLSGISGASDADVTLTGLLGEYTITAVAVNAGNRTTASTVFMGLEWDDVATGTYKSTNTALNLPPVPSILQICTTNDKLYRFKDAFGEGNHLKINMLDIKGEDADGEYRFFRVPPTETPFTYGQHGTVSVRDIGYMVSDETYVTEQGYESGMYTNDYYCFVFIQYYVGAGSLGYGYDAFIPD